jgi:hypothetical protein
MLWKRGADVVSLKNVLLFAVAGSLLCVGSSDSFAQNTQNVTLGWNPSSSTNVAGYRVYYGTTSGNYTSSTNVGNQLASGISGLQSALTYFFVVTAYDISNRESLPSNEVSYQIPAEPSAASIVLTSPGAGTSYTSPASIDLSASVTANGSVINSVQFFCNGSLLGEALSSPYALVWSNVNAGSYSLSARVVYDATNTVDSTAVSVVVTALPAPWLTCDVGGAAAAGSAIESNGLYLVSGAGNISGAADNFRLLYQTISGNGEIKARINSVQLTNSSARIGVMIRENLTKGSRYTFMGISPDGTFRWQRRSNTKGSTSSTSSGKGVLPNTWVRLVRTGNTFYGYKSIDGTNWSKVSSRSISMATNIVCGLAVASGTTNQINTSTFGNVLVVP